MSALDTLPNILADAMGLTLFRAANLYRGASAFACRALVTEYSDFQRLAGGIPEKDRNVIILARTVTTVPKAGDTIVIDGGAWRLNQIARDPAGATYECRSTRCPIPAGDATPSSTSTLLDDLPDIMNGALGPALFKAAIFYKVASRSSDGRGGFVSTFSEHACSALITDYTDLQRGLDDIPAKDRRALILAASLPAGVTPGAGDVLGIDGGNWGFIRVDADPARATFEAQATPAKQPTIGRIGYLNATLSNFTIAATGSIRLLGSAAVNLDSFTLFGRAAIVLQGQVAATLADASLSASGNFQNNGALNATLQDATLSATGSPWGVGAGGGAVHAFTMQATGTSTIQGALGVTLQNFQLYTEAANIGQLAVTLQNATLFGRGSPHGYGDLAVTLASFTLSATGRMVDDGNLAQTVANFTLAATGTPKINGALAVTLDSFTGAGAGASPIVGTGAGAIGDALLVAAGYQRNAGALSVTLGDATLSTAGSPILQGSLSVTLQGFTLSAGASNVGSLAVTLADATLSAAGYQANYGALGATLGDMILAGAGTPRHELSLAATLDSASLVGVGYQRNAGALAVTLDSFTLSASTSTTINGALAVTLDHATAVSNGTITNPGALAQTVAAAVLVADGYQRNAGALAVTLADATLSADGTPRIVGAASPTIANATVVAAGYQANAGTLAKTLADFTGSGAGAITDLGALASTLANFTLAADGYQRDKGDLAVTIDNFTLSAIATPTSLGALAVTLGDATLSTFGGPTIQAALAATLADATLSAAGTVTQSATAWTIEDAINEGVAVGMWLDANDLTSITKDGSNRVATWTDKSGSTRTATQSTDAAKPVYTASTTNFNNKPTIGPADAGDFMTIANWPEEARFMMDNGTSAWDAYNFNSLATGSVSLPENVVLAFVFPNAYPVAGDDIIYRNGTLIETVAGSASVTPAAGALFFAGRVKSVGKSSVNGRFIDGPTDTLFNRSAGDRTGDVDAGEFVYITGTVGSTLRQKIEGYLAWKWGLQASLPGGHPYASAAPIQEPVTGTLAVTLAATTVSAAGYQPNLGALAVTLGNANLSAAGAGPAGVPTYVASGALSTASAQTSRTPAAPSGRATDDIEIVTCASENNATHSYSGTGWTKGGQTNSGAGWTVSWGWRRYDGSNVDPVISWTGSADASARRHAYRGCKNSGTPVVTIGTVGTGTGSTHTSTGGNTTALNSLAVYFDHALANTAIAQPTGWTEDVDSGSATGPCRTAVGHKDMSTSGGATGNISVSGAAAAWVQQQLELLAN